MPNENGATAAPTQVTLSYQLLRNTTSPDEKATGVQSFVVNFTAFEILSLDTRENLRSYLAEFNPKKRNRVHDAIRETIEMEPTRFITRNGGFVIAASDIDVDDNAKTVTLTNPSIVNGAQSQGVIREWVKDEYGDEFTINGEPAPFFVRAELVIDPNPNQVVETAIARNTATPVKSLTQAGARGHLDELERSIQRRHPSIKIRKSETDLNVYDTRKILQYARLLMPVSVSGNASASERLRPYKNPEQCLTDFSSWFENAGRDPDAKAKYDFVIQIAPYAIDEYAYWERHAGWVGQRLWEQTKKGGRACRRDKSGRILWVSPGLIFPITGAMSEFVEQIEGEWKINKPALFKPEEMIEKAVAQFRGLNSDPMQMGRSAGAYDALRIYPSTLVEVMRDVRASRA